MSISEIKDAVADLPDRDKGALAAWLLDSLPPHSREDGTPESIEEADLRRQELNSGKVQPLKAEEFWDSINQERASWK